MSAVSSHTAAYPQPGLNWPALPLFLFRIFLVGFFAVLVLASPFVVRNIEGAVLTLLALAIFAIVSAPVFTWKDYNIFEPLTLVILMTVVGYSFKLIYVLAFFGKRDHVTDILMNGERPTALLYGSFVVAAGLICFLLGYWRRQRQYSLGRFPFSQFEEWNYGRLLLVCIPIIIVSGIFFVIFAKSMGASLNAFETFSQKRFIDTTAYNSSYDYREETLQSVDYYYYRIAACAKFAFYLGLAYVVHHRKSLFSVIGLLTAWAGLQTIAVFVFMNSRASVGLVLLDAVVITYFLKDHFKLWKVAAVLGTGALLILVQLAMRAGGDRSPIELIEKTVAGRDLTDVTKMALIIKAIPQQMDYCHGETLVSWMAAPIPARVWPKKPIWSERGVFVNQRVFGAKSTLTGITLGLTTELYWNFGWLGVILGMFLTGVFLRNLYKLFEPYSGNLSAVLIYSLAMTRLTLFTLGADFGTGVLKTALDLIPVAVLLIIVGSYRNRPNYT